MTGNRTLRCERHICYREFLGPATFIPMALLSGKIVMGARGSLLSLAQSRQVADALERVHEGLRVEVRVVQTSGDRIVDRPLNEAGGKGLFTKELELSLLRGEIDFAVHSYKDVPVTEPLVDVAGLVVAAVPRREDARDVMASAWATIGELPTGARVGTGSMRRRCQLLALRGDLRIEPIRGNIDTRLRKLRDGEHDAILLAAAGLKRAGLFDAATMHAFSFEAMLPAAGQGALALQCRRDDRSTIELLRQLNDPATARCVNIERAVVARLDGDCHSPIAALAELEGAGVKLRAAVGARDGELPVAFAAATDDSDADVLQHVLELLAQQGAGVAHN